MATTLYYEYNGSDAWATTTAPTGIAYSCVTATAAGGTSLPLVASGDTWYVTNQVVQDAVTISGTISMHQWMWETSMSANCCAGIKIERRSGTGAYISTILEAYNSSTELPTANTAINWSATPTSTTLDAGDKIAISFWAGNVGTMAAGYAVYAKMSGLNTEGDSYVQFTENITFTDRVTRTGSFPVASVIKASSGTKTFAVAALIPGGVTTQTGTFPVAAAKSLVGGCVWTTPGNGVSIGSTDPLRFYMPTICPSPMHFNMQLDTSSSFNSGNLRDLNSYVDQAGWEYWNGGSWVAVPSTGVPVTYLGNEARYTPQTELTSATWYRRVRAEGV